jgi:DME family drug/metabolite transporter
VREEWAGYGLVLAAAVLWGSIGVAVRLISAAGVGALEASTWRAGLAFAGALLASVVAHRGHMRVGLRDLLLFAAYGFVSIALFFLAYFTAIQLTTVATAAILLYTAPAWVTVLSAALFGEDLSRPKLAALLLAFAGCALVVRAYDPAALRLNLPGVLAGLAAGLTYGLYSVFGKVALRRHPPLVVLVYALGFGTVFLALGGIALGLPPQRFAPSHVAPALSALAYFGLVATWLAQWLYVSGLRRVQASRASIVATVEPVVAGVLGYLWFGEVLDGGQLVGGALVLAAAASVQARR